MPRSNVSIEIRVRRGGHVTVRGRLPAAKVGEIRAFFASDLGAGQREPAADAFASGMRVAMIAQWLRAARQSPQHRRACLTYVTAISIAQVGWVVQIVANMTFAVSAAFAVVLMLIELAGPARPGEEPHAEHRADRRRRRTRARRSS